MTFQNLFVPGLGWNYYRGQLVVGGVAGGTVRALLAENPAPERVTILAMGDQGVNRADEDEQCALYLRNWLEGRNPDPEAPRKLIMAGGQGLSHMERFA